MRRLVASGFLRGMAMAALAGAIVLGALWGAARVWHCRAERQWEVKKGELAAGAKAAEPILAALEAYGRDEGHFPPALEDLLPKYLTAIPEPRFPFEAEWTYGPRADRDCFALYVSVPHDYCPPAVVGWPLHFNDAFVYHSDGKYEPSDYGGILERIGAWAYYHE